MTDNRMALLEMAEEAYIQGVSTRSVDELVRAAGMTGISSSQVSRLCASIDERVTAFRERPIEGRWPCLWLDATYVKARDGGRIVTKACVLAATSNRRPAAMTIVHYTRATTHRCVTLGVA